MNMNGQSQRDLEIAANVCKVQKSFADAALKWGSPITLCAVTKKVSVEDVNASYFAGIRIIGENRVQEAREKFPALNPDFQLHMIGQLQTNKVKYIIDMVSMVQSLDRIELAREIDRRAQGIGKRMPCLIQLNIAREQQKAGVYEDELTSFMRTCAELPGLDIQGIMAVMPFVEDPELVRPLMRRARTWYERLRDEHIQGVTMTHLSMGMSGDYLVAADEGATMVRIGSLIFDK